MCPSVSLQVESVVESLATEGTEVPFDLNTRRECTYRDPDALVLTSRNNVPAYYNVPR